MKKHRFYRTCVGWPACDVHAPRGLRDMIERNRAITRRTFLRHIDRDELRKLERHLGYVDHPSQGLTMAADWAVSYHRSTWHNRTVYYFRHSAIEFVFI